MKHLMNFWMLTAVVALASTACTKYDEADVAPQSKGKVITFTTEEIGGRTAFGDPAADGKSYPTLWNDGDQIKVNYNLAYDEVNTTSLLLSNADGKNPKVVATTDRKSASFEVELTEAVTYPCTFYAVCPAGSWTHWNDEEAGIFFLKLPDTQIATADSCDPTAQLLIGASDKQEAESDQVSLRFKHFSAYGLFSLAGLPEGATLSSVKITAAKEIAGTLFYDVKNATYEGSGLKKSITVTTSSADKIWVALLPVDLSNTTLKVEATTRLGTYTKSITLGDNRKLQSGHIAKMTIDLSDATFVPREDVQVGDVWYEAGKPVGVVYWVSDDGNTVKVYHLKRVGPMPWASATDKTGINDNPEHLLCYQNTDALRTWQLSHPSVTFKMLEELAKLNADGNTWYWPTRRDLETIACLYYGVAKVSAIVKKTKADLKASTNATENAQYEATVQYENFLKSIEADPWDDLAETTKGTTYWSSCEDPSTATKAWYYRFGSYGGSSTSKTTSYYGRPVKMISNVVNRKLEEELRAASWTSQTLREGVKVHSASLSLFGRPQKIYVTTITLSATNQLGIYHPGSLKKVSTQAAAVSALVAVNGGYFSETTQGFVRVDGTVQENGIDMSGNTATFRKTFAGGALVINNNTPSFKLVDGNADAAALEDANVLVCGPLLWLDGVKQALAENSDHNSELHPRTAIGVTENGTFLMVAVDGRSTKATGMSNFEMQQLMAGLRAKSALNLDGGGSTEMWEKTNGVVNNPSDGVERAVANIVYVK